MSTKDAQKRWELENGVQEGDALFTYNKVEQQQEQGQRPWAKDPHYFKHVRISALALLKMAIHAKSGGNIEVMGIMQGKIAGDTFIVMDAFALPVEGTETRVNAQAEAYEYTVDFAESCKAAGRLENAVGWYHSHPGYGCWLSGIDVNTQSTQQQFTDPFLAVVVDPHRTVAAGKVEIGAFRTYPPGYKPPDEPESEYQSVPMNKIEDFGVHCKSYYGLDISYFKSSLDSGMLDLLWNKYWVNTLSSSPLLATKDLTNSQIKDIAAKIEASDSAVQSGRRFQTAQSSGKKGKAGGGESAPMRKLANDASTLSTEQIKGVSTQVVKSMLFSSAANGRGEILKALGSTATPMES